MYTGRTLVQLTSRSFSSDSVSSLPCRWTPAAGFGPWRISDRSCPSLQRQCMDPRQADP